MLSHNLNLKIFFQELISFSLIGIISFFLVSKISEINTMNAIPAGAISWWQFLLAFGVGTAIVLGLIRIVHGGWFLRLFFIFAVFSGTLISISAFISDIWAFLISLILISFYFFRPYVWLHNLVLILSLSGIAVLIGMALNPWTAVAILLIMSVYDYVAVYRTKHMIKMAKTMIESRAVFALVFPEKIKDFLVHLDKAHPGEGFMMLGTGDFVFPVIMAVSAYSVSVAAFWTVGVFSLLGLFVMHTIFVSQKVRRPMPALPPLAAFAILGFIVSILFNL